MDILCVICKEPWDAWGVRHGDMAPWEADLFRKGAGCPCCEGEPPESGIAEPTCLADIDNGDEDPMVRLNAYEAALEGKAPKWERPDNPVIWECSACGVQVVRDLDYDEHSEYAHAWHVPRGSNASNWWASHYFDGTPDLEPMHKHEDMCLCENCYCSCDNCGADLCSNPTDDMETEHPLYSFPQDCYGRKRFCYDCECSKCMECGELPDECTCQDDAEEDEDEA